MMPAMNKFESAARLLKAVRKLLDAEAAAKLNLEARYAAKRDRVLKDADPDVCQLVLAELYGGQEKLLDA